VDPGLIPMMLKIGYYVSMSAEYANLLKTIFFMLDAHSTGQTFWTLLEQHVMVSQKRIACHGHICRARQLIWQ
jgi:hypothetical protein